VAFLARRGLIPKHTAKAASAASAPHIPALKLKSAVMFGIIDMLFPKGLSMSDTDRSTGTFAQLFGWRSVRVRSRSTAYPVICGVIYIVLFSGYYIFQVPKNQAEIVARSFRALALMGEQVRSDLENSAVVLKTQANGLAQHFRDEQMDLIPGHLQVVDCPHQLSFNAEIELAADHNAVAAILGVKPDAAGPPLCARTTIDGTVAPFASQIPYDVFEDIAIADADGRVLYQKAQTAFRLADIQSLLDQADLHLPPSQTSTSDLADAAKSLLGQRARIPAGFSRLVDVTLAGEKFKMFVQPISWPLAEVHGGRPFQLLLCGFLSTGALTSRSRMLPSHFIVIIFCSIVIGLLAAWPILKLRWMPPTEGFRPRELLWFAISILISALMVTILVLYWTQLSGASLEPQLTEMAKNIEGNFQHELDAALATLQSFSESKRLGDSTQLLAASALQDKKELKRAFDKTRKTDLLVDVSVGAMANRWYPYFDQAFWSLNLSDPAVDGFQGIKWTVQRVTTGLTSAKEFKYYADLRAGRFWQLKLPADSHIRQTEGDPAADFARFTLEPMYSPNTGEYITVLAQPIINQDLNKLGAAVMVTPMLSLVNPVMPAGFGFAVVDEEGMVRFHSDASRNGRENFFREFDQAQELRAAMVSGSPRFLEGKYQGRVHFVYARPLQLIRNSHWALVVFLDTADREHFYFDVFLLTMACSVCFTLWECALIGIGSRLLIRVDPHWHWPEASKIRTLNLLVLFSGLLFATGIGILLFAPPWVCSAFVWCVPPAALGLAVLGFRQHYRGKALECRVNTRPLLEDAATRLKTFPFHRAAYAFLCAALLMVCTLAILPAAIFFRLAFDYERLPYMADQQLRLAARLESRASRIRGNFSKVKTSVLFTLGTDEAFLAQRIRSRLDRYDLLWRDTHPVFTAEPWKAGDLATLSGDFITRKLSPLTALVPHPLSATERMNGNDQWAWSLEGNPDILVMTNVDKDAGEEVHSYLPIRSDLSIFRRPQPLALVLIAGLILLIFYGLHYTAFQRFLIELRPEDRWPEFDIHANERIDRNLLVIGWPRTGKTKLFKDRDDCEVMSVRDCERTNIWCLQEAATGKKITVAVVDEFEYGIDNAGLHKKKLSLVEGLVKNRDVKVIIVSTVDPMFYLFEEYFDPNSLPSIDAGLADQPVYKTAVILSSFEKRTMTATDGGRDQERDQLLWASCSRREQLALSQLSMDGAVNPKNKFALKHLYARRLVDERETGEGICRIADEGFAKFVGSELPEKFVEVLRKSEPDTAWHGTKSVYVVTILAGILFLLTAWQDVFKAGLSEIAGLVAAVSGAVAFLPSLAQFAMNIRKPGGGINA
jgi:hypothetical protein